MGINHLNSKAIHEIRMIQAINSKAETVDEKTARKLYSVLKANAQKFHTPVKNHYASALIAIVKGESCQCVACQENPAISGNVFCETCNEIDFKELEEQVAFEEMVRDDQNVQFQDSAVTVEKTQNVQFQDSTVTVEKTQNLAREGERIVKSSYQNIVKKVNDMTGEEGEVKFRLRDFFTDVFKHHSTEDAEKLFICGTEQTTPKESEISLEWPKPWIYARVFMLIFIAYALLYFLVGYFGNSKGYPGIMFVGAMLVPVSVLVFFWEINVPRNINIVEVVKIFFIGGTLSLVYTLTIDSFLNVQRLDYAGALLTGFSEEVAKAIALMVFLKKPKYKYILNGLLLGAAVGAGFAVLETAGYAFEWFIMSCEYNDTLFSYVLGKANPLQEVVSILTARNLLAVGAHVAWTAFVGAGIMVVKKNHPISREHIFDMRFIKFLLISIILHGLWDSPLCAKFPEIAGYNSFYFLLIAVVWVLLFIVISAGLRQVSRVVNEAKNTEEV